MLTQKRIRYCEDKGVDAAGALLFVKYVSDKYASHPCAAITIPPGASFADMVAL